MLRTITEVGFTNKKTIKERSYLRNVKIFTIGKMALDFNVHFYMLLGHDPTCVQNVFCPVKFIPTVGHFAPFLFLTFFPSQLRFVETPRNLEAST